ncbi:MAG: hypothetical protein K2H85_01105 [Allobaculum sp.]|nr:hypothetical protein [Allobaculum sp.]
MTLLLTALVGIALGIGLGLLIYTKEWFDLYTKLAQLKQENGQLHNTIRRLQLEVSWKERGATFEED